MNAPFSLGSATWCHCLDIDQRNDQPTKQENIMISFINPRNTVLAFAFAGFAGIGMSSFASQASAGLLDECRASSKTKVVACCKQHIARFGRPTWMSNG